MPGNLEISKNFQIPSETRNYKSLRNSAEIPISKETTSFELRKRSRRNAKLQGNSKFRLSQDNFGPQISERSQFKNSKFQGNPKFWREFHAFQRKFRILKAERIQGPAIWRRIKREKKNNKKKIERASKSMLILRSLQPASLQHVSVTYRSFFKMVLLIPCGLWLTTITLHHGTITLGLIVAGVSVYSHVRCGIVWAVCVVLVLNVRLARDVGRRQGGLTAWRVYAVHAAPVHLVHVRRMLRWPLHLLRETVTEVRWFSYRYASIAVSLDFGRSCMADIVGCKLVSRRNLQLWNSRILQLQNSKIL